MWTTLYPETISEKHHMRRAGKLFTHREKGEQGRARQRRGKVASWSAGWVSRAGIGNGGMGGMEAVEGSGNGTGGEMEPKERRGRATLKKYLLQW